MKDDLTPFKLFTFKQDERQFAEALLKSMQSWNIVKHFDGRLETIKADKSLRASPQQTESEDNYKAAGAKTGRFSAAGLNLSRPPKRAAAEQTETDDRRFGG